jgi:hypothetical protein
MPFANVKSLYQLFPIQALALHAKLLPAFVLCLGILLTRQSKPVKMICKNLGGFWLCRVC